MSGAVENRVVACGRSGLSVALRLVTLIGVVLLLVGRAPSTPEVRPQPLGLVDVSAAGTSAADVVSTAAAAIGPDFTVTKTASPTSLGLGGGTVTYTYAVTNTGTEDLLYRSGSDDKCPSVGYVSGGHQLSSGNLAMASGETVIFRCSQTVTQNTTNVATFQFATGACSVVSCIFGTTITRTATASVTVQQPTFSCNTIWYGSMFNGASTTGSIGYVLPAQQQVATVAPASFPNTAAVAINPKAPDYVYYSPRTGTDFAGQLWRMPIGGGAGANINAPASPAWSTNRIAFASDGTLWSFAADGHLYSWAPGSASVIDHGAALSPSNTATTINFPALTGGDITFDGLGNMWILASDGGTTYLMTISEAELDKTSGIGTKLVGVMNPPTSGGAYNGIAFDMAGNLKASASTGTQIYDVDTDTGQTTVSATYPASFGQIADLASCALPKPELRATKTVSPTGFVNAGDVLTYTITVRNIGNLSAPGVTLQDDIPANTSYVASSTALNGSAVADVNGTMPYVTERQINGTGTSFAGVIPAGSAATITFRIRVNDPLAASVTEIVNQGTVRYVGDPKILTDDPTRPGDEDPTVSPVGNPQITLTKSLGTARTLPSDQFTVAVRTGSGTGAVVSSLDNATTTGSGATVTNGTGTTGAYVGQAGTPYFLTESGAGVTKLARYNARLTCTDSTGRTTGLPDNAVYTGSNSITPAVGARIACVITNTGKQPALKLTKALGDSRVKDSDQFTVGIRTGSANGPVVSETADSTTTGTGATVTAGTGTTGSYVAAAGTSYYLTESAAGSTNLSQYAKAITCTDANGVQTGLPNGAAFNTALQITPALGSDISCVLTNTAVHVDVLLEKVGKDGSGAWSRLGGSSWDLRANDGGSPGALINGVQVQPVAGQSGLFAIDDLVPDTYWLTETTAPNGHSLLAEPISFSLASDGTVTIGAGAGNGVVTVSSTAGGQPQITVRNYGAGVLPEAGGTGGGRVVVGALALFALAAMVALLLRRRRNALR